jgi:hypothetical protein
MDIDAAEMVGRATQQIITRGSYITEAGTEHIYKSCYTKRMRRW